MDAKGNIPVPITFFEIIPVPNTDADKSITWKVNIFVPNSNVEKWITWKVNLR